MREITWGELIANKDSAKVIDNCGTIMLQGGERVIADRFVGINPELCDEDGKLVREFFDWTWEEWVRLPVDYTGE